MAKRLTTFILIALVAGLALGWALNAGLDDGGGTGSALLKNIAYYLSAVTTVFLRLIKMIIAPLVFSTPSLRTPSTVTKSAALLPL